MTCPGQASAPTAHRHRPSPLPVVRRYPTDGIASSSPCWRCTWRKEHWCVSACTCTCAGRQDSWGLSNATVRYALAKGHQRCTLRLLLLSRVVQRRTLRFLALYTMPVYRALLTVRYAVPDFVHNSILLPPDVSRKLQLHSSNRRLLNVKGFLGTGHA